MRTYLLYELDVEVVMMRPSCVWAMDYTQGKECMDCLNGSLNVKNFTSGLKSFHSISNPFLMLSKSSLSRCSP